MRIALLPLASARWNGQLTASDETGVEHVEHLIQSNVPTLVSCSAGLSRSPAIVVCVLATLQNETADESLRRLALIGHCDVSPELWSELAPLSRSL